MQCKKYKSRVKPRGKILRTETIMIMLKKYRVEIKIMFLNIK